jgi:hypothetical protein
MISIIGSFWWLTRAGREYLFAKPFTFEKLKCRWQGHPHGVLWFNAGGLEPNMHCKDCGDDLG